MKALCDHHARACVPSRQTLPHAPPPLHLPLPPKTPTGDVVLFPRFYENRSPRHLLHEIWKEYSKADSRYATRDDFTVSMEAVTAFCWGPLCLALFPAILHRKSWRFAGIAIASLGQIYGDVLYFGTCLHGGGDVGWEAFSKHSRPEALYFWFYFVVINSVWLVIPGMCLVYAVRKINAAVAR